MTTRVAVSDHKLQQISRVTTTNTTHRYIQVIIIINWYTVRYIVATFIDHKTIYRSPLIPVITTTVEVSDTDFYLYTCYY